MQEISRRRIGLKIKEDLQSEQVVVVAVDFVDDQHSSSGALSVVNVFVVVFVVD